jgi:hypothetical protein
MSAPTKRKMKVLSRKKVGPKTKNPSADSGDGLKTAWLRMYLDIQPTHTRSEGYATDRTATGAWRGKHGEIVESGGWRGKRKKAIGCIGEKED